jgi:hypothetical protein
MLASAIVQMLSPWATVSLVASGVGSSDPGSDPPPPGDVVVGAVVVGVGAVVVGVGAVVVVVGVGAVVVVVGGWVVVVGASVDAVLEAWPGAGRGLGSWPAGFGV